jgi:hypothetical protein
MAEITTSEPGAGGPGISTTGPGAEVLPLILLPVAPFITGPEAEPEAG